MVGVDYDLSNKVIPIGSSKIYIDLINSIVSAHMNEYMLLQVYTIYLLSIYQAQDFGISVNEAARNNSGK